MVNKAKSWLSGRGGGGKTNKIDKGWGRVERKERARRKYISHVKEAIIPDTAEI